jgi:hypothetical protein
MKSLRNFIAALLVIGLAACASPMSPERQTKLDGKVLYGYVNLPPSIELTKRALRTPNVDEECKRVIEDWCRTPDRFDFVNLLLVNSYTAGLRAVGTFAPSDQRVQRGDIVIVRFRTGATAQFLRIASRGESAECRWDGGGVGRALTAAGVVCEDYDWRVLRAYFYD